MHWKELKGNNDRNWGQKIWIKIDSSGRRERESERERERERERDIGETSIKRKMMLNGIEK